MTIDFAGADAHVVLSRYCSHRHKIVFSFPLSMYFNELIRFTQILFDDQQLLFTFACLNYLHLG